MPTLGSELRNKLERVVIEARDAAEAGARAALEALAVHHHEPYPHMKPAQRELRNHLRARARQLGDRQESTGRLTIDHLANECAYEHWHRMLFARFLAENGLLIEPQENMAISLAEAEELAKEDGVDVWVFASRCAQGMLPQIFRPDDPLLQVSFATEHMIKLEKLLASLPQAVFTASDALGWVYQFWQSKKKDDVNRSEVKIGADEISAVTQLFTEPYMVEFLLHNTLGAWWAGKKLAAKDAASAKGEDELRRKLALPGAGWEYLRFVRGADGKGGPWRPAAGMFDGWPKTTAELKVLDPCCGSGHFLVAALHHLVPIRMAEEGLSATKAVDAVLRDNLHGLEIDERCCQIAAFALAFAAWTYPDAGDYRQLPDLHIACTGIGPQSTQEQWLKLAEQSGIPMPTVRREASKNGLLNLHRLFSQAPTLGSLINPAELPADLLTADYEMIQPYLAAIMSAEKADDETRERAIAAASMVKAADLLAGEYTLVVTNVPYLARGKQSETLKAFCETHFPLSRTDLATVFLERAMNTLSQHGAISLVAPLAWQAQTAYRGLRAQLLRRRSLQIIARLGPRAFETISGEVVNVGLYIIQANEPCSETCMHFLDAVTAEDAPAKARKLQQGDIRTTPQSVLREAQGHVISPTMGSGTRLLEEYVQSVQGIKSGDDPCLCRCFWELPRTASQWRYEQGTTKTTMPYGGREKIIWWARKEAFARFQGQSAWDRGGVIVNQMASLSATLSTGEVFDGTVSCIVPVDPNHVSAIWAFCSSQDYVDAVRAIDNALGVSNSSLAKVPFDLAHWRKLAAEKYPNGLPEPESEAPIQWLFHGWPEESTAPLQVAVARMLGYRWPAELDDKMRLSKRARALVKRCEELAKGLHQNNITQ